MIGWRDRYLARGVALEPGLAERRSHDYVRHGTSTLFAALYIATGQVTGACKPRHRHQEFLAFLKQVTRAYLEGELHLVMPAGNRNLCAGVATWRSHMYQRDAVTTTLKRAPQTP